MNIPTSRSELLTSGATAIAEVDSYEGPGKTVWTALSLWWIDDADRPYLAVVEGRTSNPDLEPRFRISRHGSLSKALASFDDSQLRDKLVAALPADLETAFPDANTLRARRAAEAGAGRGYKGIADMRGALCWLYEGDEKAGGSVNAMARAVEADFGVPWRTVTNTLNGGALSGWAAGFIAVLRFFDRNAWRHAKKTAAREEERTHDSTSAIDDYVDMPAPYGRHQDGRPREVTECD